MSIPRKELESRWEKIQSKMVEDAILIPLGINFYYLFGKHGMPTERIIAGIIPKDSSPFLITPAFEKTNLQRSTGIDDIVTWEETEDAYQVLGAALLDHGIENTLGLDPKLWVVEMERIAYRVGLRMHSVGDLLDTVRSQKSEWEISQLKKAAQYSAEGIIAALDQLKTGMTEKEFARVVQEEQTVRSGNPSSFCAVQFGENSAIPHGQPTDKKLRDNRVVLVDAGTSYNGYQGDITITIPHGHPDNFREIYEIVYEANRMALDIDHEGVNGAELDKIARDHITSKGYGEYFTHRLGHGIGLEVHETPYIVGTNGIPLNTGNCHTIEPGIYMEQKFGVRIEDDVVVKKNYAELLFDTNRYNF